MIGICYVFMEIFDLKEMDPSLSFVFCIFNIHVSGAPILREGRINQAPKPENFSDGAWLPVRETDDKRFLTERCSYEDNEPPTYHLLCQKIHLPQN